jgi:hypothetical protein
LFHRPLSQQAFSQFNTLKDQIHNRETIDDKHRWTYSWTSPHYSSMKMYKIICEKPNRHNLFKLLWSTACRLRHKIFFWFLLHDIVSTRNLLHRMSMFLEEYTCALRPESAEETLIHLFWNCPFSLNCWFHLLPTKKRHFSIR